MMWTGIVEAFVFIIYTVMFVLSYLDERIDALTFYAWFIMFLLVLALLYFLWHSLVRRNSMELAAFLIFATVGNAMVIYRCVLYYTGADSSFINNKHSDEDGSKSVADVAMSAVALAICVSSQLIYLVSARPVFDELHKEVFYGIGGGESVWNVYEWFSTVKSMGKVHFTLNLMFVVTNYFFGYTSSYSTLYFMTNVIFTVLIFSFFLLINHVVNK